MSSLRIFMSVIVILFNKHYLLFSKLAGKLSPRVEWQHIRYTPFSEMDKCAEMAFSPRQNAENEHRQTHKKKVQT
jgi:hypothetical protein